MKFSANSDRVSAAAAYKLQVWLTAALEHDTMSISSINSGPSAFAGIDRRQAAQQRFEAGDTDKSGGLSLDEFQAASAKGPGGAKAPPGAPDAATLFSNLDSDSDGNLTQGELESPFQRLGNETRSSLLSAQEGGPGGPPPGGPPPGGPPPGGPPPGGGQGAQGSSDTGTDSLISLLKSQDDSEEEDSDTSSELATRLREAIAGYAQPGNSTAGSSTVI